MPDLFTLMLERRASHLHIVPGSPIMLRAAGTLSPLDGQLVSPADTATLLESFLTEEQRYYFFENKDLNITQSVPGLSRFRINVFQQRGSVAFVIATHPPTPPTMEDLGLPDSLKKVILNTQQGMIIVTGGRGSGKSSTLASIVNYMLEMRNVNIVSLENPIDYLHKNKRGVISQREIGSDVLSWEAGLESLNFQQPDVVMTTEFENYEVVSSFINMAVGGTVVLVMMRSPSVAVALDNILNMFPPHLQQHSRNLLAFSVECVISQTLLKKSDGSGLVPAFEVMTGIPPVRQMIREGKIPMIGSLMASSGREYGMQTQEQALRSLVRKNVVTQDEAHSRAVRPEEFKKMMALPF
jgi:twitching motility protein PilT